jgi:hypothetical protein
MSRFNVRLNVVNVRIKEVLKLHKNILGISKVTYTLPSPGIPMPL